MDRLKKACSDVSKCPCVIHLENHLANYLLSCAKSDFETAWGSDLDLWRSWAMSTIIMRRWKLPEFRFDAMRRRGLHLGRWGVHRSSCDIIMRRWRSPGCVCDISIQPMACTWCFLASCSCDWSWIRTYIETIGRDGIGIFRLSSFTRIISSCAMSHSGWQFISLTHCTILALAVPLFPIMLKIKVTSPAIIIVLRLQMTEVGSDVWTNLTDTSILRSQSTSVGHW